MCNSALTHKAHQLELLFSERGNSPMLLAKVLLPSAKPTKQDGIETILVKSERRPVIWWEAHVSRITLPNFSLPDNLSKVFVDVFS